MAREKEVQSRTQQKHDIEFNWLKAITFVPKSGEIIVYDAEKEGDTTPDNRDLITYARIKIGDGVTVVNNLPFSALHNFNIDSTEEVLNYLGLQEGDSNG